MNEFLHVFGPGFIVMEADNDAGGVLTYWSSGASMLWPTLLTVAALLIPTFLVQEAALRAGIATGSGHMKLIFHSFGKFWGFLIMGLMLGVNLMTLVTEFSAGVQLSKHWGIDYKVLPAFLALISVLIIMIRNYWVWEKVMIALCGLDIIWFFKVLMTPAAAHVAVQAPGSVWMQVVGLIGTTIAPWQIYFQQRCVVDKGIKSIFYERLDTFLSAVFTILAAMAMAYVGYLKQSAEPDTWLWLNAALLGTVAVSLTNSWIIDDYEFDGRFGDSHIRAIFIVSVVVGLIVTLIPGMPLDFISVLVQDMAAIVLPLSLVTLGILVNDELTMNFHVGGGWIQYVLAIILTASIIVSAFGS